MNPATFFAQARSELSKVVWPTRAETIKLTVIVIAISAGVALFISALDIVFVGMNQILIR